MGVAYWCMSRDELGRPTATIDCYSGVVSGSRHAKPVKLRECGLALDHHGANDAVGDSRSGTTWALIAMHAEGENTLLTGISLRDAEILFALLQPYGFAARCAAERTPREVGFEVTT